MADGGPPAPQPPPVVPPVPLVQPVVPPAHPAQPVVPQAQPGPVPKLNWLHLKLNLQVSQMKMQKFIFLEQMMGATLMHSKKVSKFKGFAKH